MSFQRTGKILEKHAPFPTGNLRASPPCTADRIIPTFVFSFLLIITSLGVTARFIALVFIGSGRSDIPGFADLSRRDHRRRAYNSVARSIDKIPAKFSRHDSIAINNRSTKIVENKLDRVKNSSMFLESRGTIRARDRLHLDAKKICTSGGGLSMRRKRDYSSRTIIKRRGFREAQRA